MLCKLIVLSEEGFSDFSSTPAVAVPFMNSFVGLHACEDGVFVLVEDGLVAGVLGVDGLSESSTISNGNDMLDPSVLEVELWRLAYSSSNSLVFWATCGETCLLCSVVEDT
jgi:hypothetical protein